ncbi:MAG TPA: ribosome maturation factor RimP [Blastocatellia bacterium]|jgi:ribosome maturation factor RimP|nr:ribosome maturation factor RimP [Blastocatellia bacterium]
MSCLLREWAWPTFFLGTMIEFDREAIERVIERVAAREGLEVVHWEAVGPRNNFVLRIYIDKPGGVTHGDCETVSNQVGTLLDLEDLIVNRYVLEVSSPGIERGLYKRADYERFSGNRIKVRTAQPIDGQRNFRGKLLGFVGESVSLDADGRGQIEIPYDQIVKANIEYEF